MFLRAQRPASAIAVVLAFVLLTPGQAGADYIAGNLPTGTNLGVGGGFNAGSGFSVLGTQATGGPGYAIAVRFTMGATTMTFDSARLGLVFFAGINAINLSLVGADSRGLPLATALETIHLGGLSATPGLVTATSATHPTLAAGMSYWLVATPDNAFTNVGWLVNNTGQIGHSAYRTDSAAGPGTWTLGSSFADASFAVFGTPTAAVDEPPSSLLCGVGLVGLVASHRVRRRRRN